MKWLWIGLGIIIVVVVIMLIYKYNTKNEDNNNTEELPDEIIIPAKDSGSFTGVSGKGFLHYTKDGDIYTSHYTRSAGPMKETITKEVYKRGYEQYLKYQEDSELYYKSLV